MSKVKYKEGDKVKIIKPMPKYLGKEFILGGIYKVYSPYNGPYVSVNNQDDLEGYIIDGTYSSYLELYKNTIVVINSESDYYKWLAGDRE